MRRWRTVLCALALVVPLAATAHEGPTAEIAALDAALRARPGDLDLLVRRAEAHRRRGDLAHAAGDLAEAARRAPDHRAMLRERAVLAAGRGDRAAALADLDRLLAGGPDLQGHRLRARLHAETGRHEAARRDWDAALALRPDPDLYLARAETDRARGRLDEAAAGLREGFGALGAVVLRDALVDAERARGRYDLAIAIVDGALRGAPARAELLLVRAELEAGRGNARRAARDRREALRECDAALARRPSDLRRLTRARALLALGRAREARAELEALARRAPGLDEAHILLARLGGPR